MSKYKPEKINKGGQWYGSMLNFGKLQVYYDTVIKFW